MSSSENTFIKYDLLSDRLRDLRDAWLAEPSAFAPGDLVAWKPGFQQGHDLFAGECAVVLAAREVPVAAVGEDADSSGYRLPLDILLGVIDERDEFVTFATSRRFLVAAGPDRSRVAGRLRDTFAAFTRPEELAAGLLVRWKPFCAPAVVARPEMPAVVVEVLDAAAAGSLPSTAPVDSGFAPRVDLAVAVEDDSCGFRIVWTDRRRVTVYSGPVDTEGLSAKDAAEKTLAGVEPGVDASARIAARLQDRHRRLTTPCELPGPGSLVRWKPGLRDRLVPLDEDVAVVVELREAPVQDALAAVGTLTWRQPLTALLGCMGEDGHFVLCHYEGRRFEAADGAGGEHRAFLQQAMAHYRQPNGFAPGDLVQWKPGLLNRNLPGDGETAIVLEVLDPPLFSDHIEASSPYFLEPLSLVVGICDQDEFVSLHVDGARFQPLVQDAGWDGAEWLRARFDAYQEPVRLVPGDVVEWKEGCCPLLWSDPQDHGVVAEVLDPPAFATGHSSGSALYRQPHGLRVAFLDDEDDILMHPVDGRRLRVASPGSAQDELLLDAYSEFAEERKFEVGQVVQWSGGLQGWGFLHLTAESPGIVLHRLAPPLRSEQRELLADDFAARADLVVGGFDDDGDFAVVPADSRRLRLHAVQRGAVARRLRGFRRRLQQPPVYSVGDLVAWKDRMCAHAGLIDGVPAIVLEILEQPCEDRPAGTPPTTGLGSPDYAASRDTVVGVWMDGRFLRLYCDGRRLEPFDPRIHGEILRRQAREEARRMDEFSRMLEDYDDDDPPF